MPTAKRRILIILSILIVLIFGYLFWGKEIIYPPRASEALALYNIDSRYGDGLDFTHMPTRTVRWKTLPVAVYNEANIKNLQNIIDEWNQAMGRAVFVIGDESSPIIIKADAEIQPDGFANFSFRDYLLENFQIRVHPDLTPLRAVKKMLGHALGFFGRTTDDHRSIMDIDPDDNNIIITPFVISVLNELYSLPPGVRGTVVPDKKIRDAVKKYNIDSLSEQYRYFTLQEVEAQKYAGKLPDPIMPTKTVRWRNLPVTIYDHSNLIPNLPTFINEWNQAMGREVFKIGGPDSPITFEAKLAESQQYELFSIEAKKAFYLKRIRFFNDSEWITPGKIRHQLGHALGFFGHTTDDPDGIMDADYDKQKIISPLVISVLKELYRLPPGTKIPDQFGRPDEEVLVLRQAIKKYNNEARGERPDIRTVHWRSLPVLIYNQANISGLQEILNEWNQAMGQEVFKIGTSDSPIVIEADNDPSLPPYPQFNTKTKNYLITNFKIKVNPQNPNLHYLKHQLGHALGFFGHTKDDDPNGIMNEDHSRTDTVISSFVVSVLKELYNLPPGVLINY